MSEKEVVIIGAGVIGCSIAYHLARQGVPSQIIERDSIAARASGKSWAVFAYPPRVLAMEGKPSDQLFSMPEGGVRPWVELFWLGYHRLPDVVLDLKEKGGIDTRYGELTRIIIALSESEEESSYIRKLAGRYQYRSTEQRPFWNSNGGCCFIEPAEASAIWDTA